MMDPEITQPSLLSRVRDPENQPAWVEFEAKYRELILRYCRGRGLQTADAEDVRQIVMMGLSKSLRSFVYQPAVGRFRAYLGCVVRNAITQHMARPKAGELALDSAVMATEPADDAGEADELWEREWIDHHYRLAMQTVRTTFEVQSVEIFERLLAGEPVEDVAGGLGVSTQAVHKVKQRIRDRMQELIEQQVREEDGLDGQP